MQWTIKGYWENSQYAFVFIVFREMRQEFSTETLCSFLVVNGGVCHTLGEFVYTTLYHTLRPPLPFIPLKSIKWKWMNTLFCKCYCNIVMVLWSWSQSFVFFLEQRFLFCFFIFIFSGFGSVHGFGWSSCVLLLRQVSIRDVPWFCYFLLYFGNLGHVHLVGFFTLLPLFCLVVHD